MSHMMDAIPENAQSIPAAADGFCDWIANESAGHTVTLGDVETVGHLVIARDVTAAEIAVYVSETGDAFVSDAVRSGVRPGHIAVVTDSQGSVYGYMLPDDAAAEATLTAAEVIDAGETEFTCQWCDAHTDDVALIADHMVGHCPVCGDADQCDKHGYQRPDTDA